MTDAAFDPYARKLEADSAPPLLVATFRRQYQSWRHGQSGQISRADLEDVGPLPSLDELPAAGEDLLSRTVMIKLNGGLGTGMGLDRAKSLLPVRPGVTFLDLIARQVLTLRRRHGVALPLLLMNSFNTESDTAHALARYPELARQPVPLGFRQHRIPRIRADNGLPFSCPEDPDSEWCPPGHGDLYVAIRTTGILAHLLDQGFRYAFVSNSDNLGAALDIRIPAFMERARLPFLMEVTDRTEADKKGGHLARRRGGGLLLREVAQCPEGEQSDFQDVTRHRYFNTNNLWMDLTALAATDHMDLPLIVNRKSADSRNPHSPAVIQLETAMGSAIEVFPGATALRVPRARFAPVKTTEDLLALWSDVYEVSDEGHVRLKPPRFAPPVIRLDPKFYKVMSDFESRFPHGAPSLIACESLSVEGDHTFGRGVRVRGRVRVSADAEPKIPDGAVLSG